MLSAAVAIAAAVAVLWSRGEIFVLRLLVQPDVLLGLLVAIGLVFILHVVCVADAWRAARRARPVEAAGRIRSAGRAAVLSLLLVVAAGPYAAAAYYDFRDYDLLTSVFADEEPLDLAAAPEPLAPISDGDPPAWLGGGPPPPAETPPPNLPAPTTPAGGPEAPAPVTTQEPEPEPEPEPEKRPSYWKERGRLNLLLIGGDAGPGRWGLRTDTMIVISIDLKTRNSAIFSVPRNLQNVPFPDTAHTSLETFPDILNALWSYAQARPELFPGAKYPGPTALKETIGNLLGLRIDYFAAVDLRGFVEVIDALGGVDVDVQRHVYDDGVSSAFEDEARTVIDLQPGRYHLDGRLALGYVRTRWATSDYDRMQRQRCLVAGLAEQARVPRLLRSFPKIASTVKEYVGTDIPLRVLPDLIELLAGLEMKRLVGVSFVPPRFSTGYPDIEKIRAAVQAALRRLPNSGESGVEYLAGSCASEVS